MYRCVQKKAIVNPRFKMRTLYVEYCYTSIFKISSKIPLLTVEENNKVEENNIKPWSWWIKWDTLHYIDDKGEEHTITPELSASEADFKHPSDNIQFDEDNVDSDEEDSNVYIQ